MTKRWSLRKGASVATQAVVLTGLVLGCITEANGQSTPIATNPVVLCAGVHHQGIVEPPGTSLRQTERGITVMDGRVALSAKQLLQKLSLAYNSGDWLGLNRLIHATTKALCIYDEDSPRFLSVEEDFLLVSWLGWGPLDSPDKPNTLFQVRAGKRAAPFLHHLPGLYDGERYFSILLTDRAGGSLKTQILSKVGTNPADAEVRDLLKANAAGLAASIGGVALVATLKPAAPLDTAKAAIKPESVLVSSEESLSSRQSASLRVMTLASEALQKANVAEGQPGVERYNYRFQRPDDAQQYVENLQAPLTVPHEPGPVAQAWVIKPPEDRASIETTQKLQLPLTLEEVRFHLNKSWVSQSNIDPSLLRIAKDAEALVNKLAGKTTLGCRSDFEECRLAMQKALALEITWLLTSNQAEAPRYESLKTGFSAALKDLKPIESTTTFTIRNEPPTKVSYAVLTAYLSQPRFFGESRDRTKVGNDGQPIAERLPTVLAAVGALWSPGGFDAGTPKVRKSERLRLFGGLAITPHAGAVVGGSFTMTRGFTATVGLAFLGMQARTRVEPITVDRVVGMSAFYGLSFGSR